MTNEQAMQAMELQQAVDFWEPGGWVRRDATIQWEAGHEPTTERRAQSRYEHARLVVSRWLSEQREAEAELARIKSAAC